MLLADRPRTEDAPCRAAEEGELISGMKADSESCNSLVIAPRNGHRQQRVANCIGPVQRDGRRQRKIEARNRLAQRFGHRQRRVLRPSTVTSASNTLQGSQAGRTKSYLVRCAPSPVASASGTLQSHGHDVHVYTLRRPSTVTSTIVRACLALQR